MHVSERRFARHARRGVAVAAVGLVALPAFTGHDSTPLSTYPMYAFVRPRDDRFQTVLGQWVDGATRPLAIRVIADTDDPLIAQSLVADAIAGGRATELCTAVAARAPADVQRVLVVDEVHDVVARAERRPSLRAQTVHATCDRVG